MVAAANPTEESGAHTNNLSIPVLMAQDVFLSLLSPPVVPVSLCQTRNALSHTLSHFFNAHTDN